MSPRNSPSILQRAISLAESHRTRRGRRKLHLAPGEMELLTRRPAAHAQQLSLLGGSLRGKQCSVAEAIDRRRQARIETGGPEVREPDRMPWPSP